MWFIDQIISQLVSARDWLYEAYQGVKGIPFVGEALATPFYWLYKAFYHLAIYFSDFNEWVDSIVNQIASFLTWNNLTQWFKEWRDKILDAWNWFIDRWRWFTNEVNEWWSARIQDIKDLIIIATEGFNELKAEWDTFWIVTFPNLIDNLKLENWWGFKVKDIDRLIKTWFTDYERFWDKWQDIRDTVFEFFQDPLEWLWSRFTDWFLGGE